MAKPVMMTRCYDTEESIREIKRLRAQRDALLEALEQVLPFAIDTKPSYTVRHEGETYMDCKRRHEAAIEDARAAITAVKGES